MKLHAPENTCQHCGCELAEDELKAQLCEDCKCDLDELDLEEQLERLLS